MKRSEFLNNHWNYYLMLEDKFINTTKYAEISYINRTCYSMEFVNQLLLIGSEVDVAMKTICGLLDRKRTDISDYVKIILPMFPTICSQEIKVAGKEMTIKPYENWNQTAPAQSLVWWQAYNDVKHKRVLNIELANQENTLNSLAGLFVLENFWLKQITSEGNTPDVPDKKSQLFYLLNWKTKYINAGNDLFFESIEHETSEEPGIITSISGGKA